MANGSKSPRRSQSFKVEVQIENMRETLAAVRALGKEAEAALRDRAFKLGEQLAQSIARAAASDKSPQTRIVAATLKVKRDRLPVLEVGGTKRIGRNRVPAYALLFGAEFGSVQYRQFHKAHQGKAGSWFFPTVEREQAEIVAAWEQAADDVVREFGEGS